MPNFLEACELHRRCSLALVYQGNTYRPAYLDNNRTARHDAHVATTWKLAKAIVLLYADIAAEGY